ncbi:AraC family transcriptional regulator [Pedobacter cryoconitis]|uniref:AraC-like DNA-binding protein n=1 Tax=Pedobacter cryoconitis TaxID=188932 RepID=A0A327SG78_9SPHI|nr:AraC family transcriptional regulator [Pedobacter cryoconitis]RAJ28110.1 AraC-like DNA-binding protein [Pedobacter cryoconitis]
MKTLQLFQDVEVTIKEITSNTSGLHRHYFFEMIYVMKGSGIHNINNNHFEFFEGDIFLLTPDDAHTFRIENYTKFCIIDFTENFFSRSAFRKEEKMDVGDFFKRLEYIFHNHHGVTGNLVAESDKNLFKVLITQLIEEKENQLSFSNIITQNIVFLLLHLIARNIQQNIISISKIHNPKDRIHEITVYVQQHIYAKELIKIENISAHFNKSPDHLNRYFKQQTGNTIKDYITKYKLELIKTRLKYSDLTITEIANEMNFTDESHLNKTFKSVFGQTASQFKKTVG